MAVSVRPWSRLTSPTMQLSQTARRLAPGLRVVGRGLHHLQVGLYDGRRALLPRTAVAEQTIASLLGQAPLPEDPGTGAVLALLDRQHCLAGATDPSLGPGARSGADGTTVAVLGRFSGPGLPDTAALLREADVAMVNPRAPVANGCPPVDVALVLSTGELAREVLDPLVRARTSHLVVRLVDGGAVLGPFVVPGETACLRCIDAHESVRDPDHVAVTTRYVHATARPRRDGVPDTDPALASVALAWGVRDVLAHLDGRAPSTWSRTISLGADLCERRERDWLRHSQCGCSWPLDLLPRQRAGHAVPEALLDRTSGTMGR